MSASELPESTLLPAAADEVMDRVARLTAAALGTPGALVSMVSRREQVLPGAVGLPSRWLARRATPVSMSLCRHVVATGRAMSVDDVRAEPAMSDPAVTTELGVVAWAGAPVRALAAGEDTASTTAEVIGVVCAVDDSPRAWEPADLVVLTDLAAVCAGELRLRGLEGAAQRDLAASRASQHAAEAGRTAAQGSQLQAEAATHLAQTVQRQTQAALGIAEAAESRAAVLLALSEALSDVRTTDDLSAAVHRVATEHLGVNHTGLLVPQDAAGRAGQDGGRGSLRHVRLDTLPPGSGAGWQAEARDDGPAAVAARTRRTVVLDSEVAPRAAHPEPGRTSAHVPLVTLGEVTGVLVLVWSGPRRADPAEREVWEALGRYTSQALARVTLGAQLRSSAEVLQRSLLTRLPEPDHLEVRARYLPAAVGDEVGGDWYDALVLPDGATAVVIGDVVGHDIGAAAVMGQVRGALRALAWDRGEPASDVVRRLDASLGGLGVGSMATLVLGRVEQAAPDAAGGPRRLRWTNAGHPPPVLVLPDGTTRLLGGGEPDLLVGVDPGTARQDHVVELPAGSTLLLYTDGLVERRGADLAEGLDALQRVLGTLAGAPLDELLDAVLERLVGAAPADDCALLAVRAHREVEPPQPHTRR